MNQSLRALRRGAARFVSLEPFFLIALAATLAVSIFSHPRLTAVRWNVIAILFSQMLVCAAFEECQVLTSLAERTLRAFASPKKLVLAMIVVTGLLAMLVTNDIALLTVVPLTIGMARMTGRDPYILVILETISANIFSALTPFGNPQNLYLYSFYHISAARFFEIMLPLGAFGAVLLVAAALVLSRGEKYRACNNTFAIRNKRLLAGASAAFVLNILAVLRVLDYRLTVVLTLLIFLALAPRLIKKVDFILLMTFVLFFLFVDGVTSLSAVRQVFAALLRTKYHVLLVSAAVSQVISNVPAAVLLSGFTSNDRELLYGVSAGGLGTLVASLASLISYKLYVREFKAPKYLKLFLLLNFTFLAVLLLFLSVVLAVSG